jgi:hypothetical protein
MVVIGYLAPDNRSWLFQAVAVAVARSSLRRVLGMAWRYVEMSMFAPVVANHQEEDELQAAALAATMGSG